MDAPTGAGFAEDENERAHIGIHRLLEMPINRVQPNCLTDFATGPNF